MIIDGDDLRRDAPSVVGAEERFVGLPPQPPLAAEDVTEASVRKKIAKTFPSFDERIGWSIHGEYDDEGLPAAVQSTLDAFFAPHNAEFFKLLGRELPDWTRPAGAALGGDRDDKRAEALAEIGLGV